MMTIGVLIFEQVPCYPSGHYPSQVLGFGAPALPVALEQAEREIAWLTRSSGGREHHAAFHRFCEACHASGRTPCTERCAAPKGFCRRRHRDCKACGGSGRLPLGE